MIYFLIAGWLCSAILGFLFIRRNEELKAIKNLKSAESGLEKTFQVLAAEALKSQSESFLQLAEERLEKKNVQVSSSIQEKVTEISTLLKPVKESIEKLENGMERVEQHRSEQFGRISEQLVVVAQVSEKLKTEASSLTKALRRPEVRGSWGEIQLRRVVELAGMSAHCDFEEQASVRDGDRNLLKPDMVVRLPNNRVIVVDSKAALDAFLDATETEDLDKKQVALARHAKNIRARVQELSKKSYWGQFQNSPEFAVLFIPNEALLAAAVETDRTLIEDALQEKVIIATPTTLVSLLKAIYYGWQQNQVAENAQTVLKNAKEFYDRLSTWMTHFGKVGTQLESSMKTYNEAVGSLDSRVLPSVRRLKDLALSDRDNLPEMALSEVQVKASSRELKTP